jgi:hypothetical protein
MVSAHSLEVRVKVTVGGLLVLPDQQDYVGNSYFGISSSVRSEYNAFDQGLLAVSGNSVQLTDASEFATCIHANGPRHVPFKANTPCSNRRRLASVIPSMKYQLGSKKSRENKNRASSKKRRKQDECLIPIIPSKQHIITHILPDKFYTYVDGGDVGNPRIDPLSSLNKQNRVLSLRDGALHICRRR